MKYYLLDEHKNLVEGFDKEGFLALLEQAIENGSLENIDEDSAVASKIRSVLNGTTHHIEFVTQAQYNQLVADEELVANTWYFIIDDTTIEDLEQILSELQRAIDTFERMFEELHDGTRSVNHAVNADNADNTSFTNNSLTTIALNNTSGSTLFSAYNPTKSYLFQMQYMQSGFVYAETFNFGVCGEFPTQGTNIFVGSVADSDGRVHSLQIYKDNGNYYLRHYYNGSLVTNTYYRVYYKVIS